MTKLDEANEYHKQDNTIIDCSILLQRNKNGTYYLSITNCNGDNGKTILVNQKFDCEKFLGVEHSNIGNIDKEMVLVAIDKIKELLESSKHLVKLE